MKPGTIIKLPDGRTGTICYHHIDGYGGVWEEHNFDHVPIGFDDGFPEPEFMLREKSVETLLGIECVGMDYEIIKEQDNG